MRTTFESYYPPTEDFYDFIWKDSLIVLDTNVLLDMYRYSESTREDFITLFKKISDRLWIPHQVGLEFSKNRPGVIAEQVQMLEKAKSLLPSLRDTITKEIDNKLSFRLHPVLNKNDFTKAFEEPLIELEKKFENYTDSHPDLLTDDPILETLLDLFEGRIGPSFDEKRLDEIFKEGKDRYEKDVPPGYEDARGANKKEGNAIYGDLILWFQIIEQVKSTKSEAVIFISNDMKDDWWWSSKGRNLGCRPELRHELSEATGAKFHIYTSERFLHYASKRIKIKVREESVDEVKKLEQANRKANEKATGAYAGSIFKQLLEDQRRREKILSSLQPGLLSSFVEENAKRQETLNKIMGSSIGQNGSIAKALEKIRIQHDIGKNAFGSLDNLSAFKDLAGNNNSSILRYLNDIKKSEDNPTIDNEEDKSDSEDQADEQ